MRRSLSGRFSWRSAVPVAVAAAVVGCAVPQAQAGQQALAGDAPSGAYLALGDSVAFGMRPPEITPPQTYTQPWRLRSYAGVTAAALSWRLVNASCPGETSASMLREDAPDNGCRLYRQLFPLHRDYPGTQVAYAVRFLRNHPRTRMVSIDVGSNDLLLCLQVPSCSLAGTVRQVGENVGLILRMLRVQGRYRGPIVTLTYYAPPGLPLPLVTALNAALSATTKQAGGAVANGYAAFRAASHGQDACAAGLLIALPTGGCDIHPTRAGHRVLAAAVIAAYLRAPVARQATRPAA